ncbi:MAG: heparinase II/III family protein, partial [Bryobacteraceae bacterium]
MPKSTRRTWLASTGSTLVVPRFAAGREKDGETQRNIMSGAWTVDGLQRALIGRANWKPFPTVADRDQWNRLPAGLRRDLVTGAEAQLGIPWPSLLASTFLDFSRNGNRSRYEKVNFERRYRLRDLVMGECVEGKGRFLDEIVNGVWLTLEETWWGVPAHVGAQRAGRGLPDATEPVVDLFAAETSSLLAWTDYLLGERLDSASPLIRPRIRTEMDRRILTPCLDRDDFWWMGFDPRRTTPVNNWNPWINSNWLTSTLLMEANEERRVRAVHKILLSLDRFLNPYHDDGGCDEGPGYWSRAGASLFDCLDLLYSATGGKLNVYDVPLVKEVARYIMRAHVAGTWFINFADASSHASPSGDLVLRAGRRIKDQRMEGFGAFCAANFDGGKLRRDSLGRCLPAIFNYETLRAARPQAPLLADVWLPGIQVMAARAKEGSVEGLYIAAQGGHNDESHNHNDVGNFVVYSDGKPVVIDVGVETYTARTFSPDRYKIWTMQSAYHNLPTIDGIMQNAGRKFEARDVSHRADSGAAAFSLDIAKAYPPEAGLKSWRRTLRLDRARNEITIADVCSLSKDAAQITLTLMTPCRVREAASGELELDGSQAGFGQARVLFEGAKLRPKVEEIAVTDARLKSVWGDRVCRILLVAERPAREASWTARIVGS